MNILQRRYNSLKVRTLTPDNSNTIQLEKYIGLNTPGLKIRLTEVSNEPVHFLNIFYTAPYTHIHLLSRFLPNELLQIIYSYLPTDLSMTFRLNYPQSYPIMSPPTWYLIEIRDRATQIPNSQEHFEYLVNLHNQTNIISWSPAMMFDGDVLNFVSRFYYLFENINNHFV